MIGRKKLVSMITLATVGFATAFAPFSLANAKMDSVFSKEKFEINVEIQKKNWGIEGRLDNYALMERGYILLGLFSDGDSGIKAGPLVGAYNSYFSNLTGIGGIGELSTSIYDASVSSKIEALKWFGNGVYFQIGFDVKKPPFRFYSTLGTNARTWGGDSNLKVGLQKDLTDDVFIGAQINTFPNKGIVYSLNLGVEFVSASGDVKASKGFGNNCTSTTYIESE